MDEMYNDWLARYSYFYKKRYSDKEKKKFINALMADIMSMREDVQVLKYNTDRYQGHSIYVGDIKKADTIICTYYDTPPSSFGSYVYFDMENQKKKTTQCVLIGSILWFILGLICTCYIHHSMSGFSLFQWKTLLLVILYGLYFVVLSRIAKGNWNGHTLIRNTSSILCMLKMMADKDNVAYAFVDKGCFGYDGLKTLRKECRKNAKIYYLDSVGSSDSIQTIQKEKVQYVFSGHQENNQWVLTKQELNTKTINEENFNEVIKICKGKEIKC